MIVMLELLKEKGRQAIAETPARAAGCSVVACFSSAGGMTTFSGSDLGAAVAYRAKHFRE